MSFPGSRIVSLIFVAGLCFFVFRNLDFDAFRETLRTADIWLFLAAALLNLVPNSIARIMRFAVLLKPLPSASPLTLPETSHLVVATRGLACVVPARGSEIYRVGELQRHGYPVSAILLALVAEPLLEAFSLGFPALGLLVLVPTFGNHVFPRDRLLYLAAALAVAAAAAGWWLSRRGTGGAIDRFRAATRGLLGLYHEPGTWASALVWSWASDIIDLGMIALCARAVGHPLGVLDCLLVLVSVNVAMIIPATPGNLGTLEAGAVLALGALGVASPDALAFALLYHGAHFFPVAALGLFAFLFTKPETLTSVKAGQVP